MRIKALGDGALVIFYNSEDHGSNNIVQGHYNALKQKMPPGITDIVPCFNSIGVYYNQELMPSREAGNFIRECLDNSAHSCSNGKIVSIPVYYGGRHGPDLTGAARLLDMSEDEVIHQHSAGEYFVWGIGFLPGFPYIGPLSPRLALPRKANPAHKVAAGSVAIAGAQTGIYPAESPGGWHVIGWTPLKMFDPESPDPCLLQPGDKITFIRMS